MGRMSRAGPSVENPRKSAFGSAKHASLARLRWVGPHLVRTHTFPVAEPAGFSGFLTSKRLVEGVCQVGSTVRIPSSTDSARAKTG